MYCFYCTSDCEIILLPFFMREELETRQHRSIDRTIERKNEKRRIELKCSLEIGNSMVSGVSCNVNDMNMKLTCYNNNNGTQVDRLLTLKLCFCYVLFDAVGLRYHILMQMPKDKKKNKPQKKEVD